MRCSVLVGVKSFENREVAILLIAIKTRVAWIYISLPHELRVYLLYTPRQLIFYNFLSATGGIVVAVDGILGAYGSTCSVVWPLRVQSIPLLLKV